MVFTPAIRGDKFVTECEFFKVTKGEEEEIEIAYTPMSVGLFEDPLLVFATKCGRRVTNTIEKRIEDSNTEGSYFSRRRKTRRNR